MQTELNRNKGMKSTPNIEKIYSGSVKDIYTKGDFLYFDFSDRYSIYDWGEMPDTIPGKGKYLTLMAELFFKYLEKEIPNIKHHFIKIKDNKLKVKKFQVLKPKHSGTHYDYGLFETRPTNTLVPLEIIYRFGTPKGSSAIKRLGFSEGEIFAEPLIEFSTKLEPTDRYLSDDEAKTIAGLDSREFKRLKDITALIAVKLQKLFSSLDLTLWDGKFEFAFDENRDFVLVDSIGLDELRVMQGESHISKETLRQYYKNTYWLEQVPLHKQTYGDAWKEVMLKKGITPAHINSRFKNIISEMYEAVYLDLKAIIKGKQSSKTKRYLEKKAHFDRQKLNILIIGSGGREHALAWKCLQDPMVNTVTVLNGNDGIKSSESVKIVHIPLAEEKEILRWIAYHQINFVIIGPEAPLVDGLADRLRLQGICVFGPGKKGAMLEASKIYSKQFMQEAGIPTAEYAEFRRPMDAMNFIKESSWEDGYVVKLDGLAAGKGVIVTDNQFDAIEAVEKLMVQNILGAKNTKIIIEEKLIGKEFSYFALIDQTHSLPIGDACDYKRIRDGDSGPNTGGMGTYSPVDWLSNNDHKEIEKTILKPITKKLKKENIPYNGVLFIGIMKTKHGMKVLEFNVRFGDPETQSLLPRIKSDFAKYLFACANNKVSALPPLEFYPMHAIHVVKAAFGYPGTEGTRIRKGDKIFLNPSIQTADFKLKGKVFYAGVKEKADELYTNGGRVLGVTTLDESRSIAREENYRLNQAVEFEGMQYRGDIGE